MLFNNTRINDYSPKLDLQNLTKYFSLNWLNKENYEDWFLKSEELVGKLQLEYAKDLRKLRNLTQF